MAQFVDADGEKEDDIKASVYASVRQIFPHPTSSDEAAADGETEGETDLVLLNTVDKVSLLKSRYHTLQKERRRRRVSWTLSRARSPTCSRSRRRTRLRSPVCSRRWLHSRPRDASPRLAELENANASLRQALQSMRETLASQQAAAEANEERVVKTQQSWWRCSRAVTRWCSSCSQPTRSR